MSYKSDVFSWLSVKDKIFLLNGPSVENVEPEMVRYKKSNPAIFGVNHIFNIETEILHKFDMKVQIWILFSTDEVERYALKIMEFVKRKESIAVFTTTTAFNKIRDIFEFHAISEIYKIVFCDSIIEDIYRLTDINYVSPYNYSTPVAINSLGLALLTLSIVPSVPRAGVYLFGCDGADSSSLEGVYFQQDRMDLGKRDTRERNIYQDMMALEAIWQTLQGQFVERRGLPVLNIFNANPNSYYSIFQKVEPYKIDLSGSDKIFRFKDDSKVVSTQGDELEIRLDMMRGSIARTIADMKTGATPENAREDVSRKFQRNDRYESQSDTDTRLALARQAVELTKLRLEEVQSSLVERTSRLEELSTELEARTREMVDTRKILVERTTLLDGALCELNTRTAELVEIRRLLVERTETAETFASELKARTTELVEIRRLLVERTEAAETFAAELAAMRGVPDGRMKSLESEPLEPKDRVAIPLEHEP